MSALGIITIAWIEQQYDPVFCKCTPAVKAVVWAFDGTPYLLRRALAFAETLSDAKVSVWDPATEDPLAAAKKVYFWDQTLNEQGGA